MLKWSFVGVNLFNYSRSLNTSKLGNKSLLSIQGNLAAEFLQSLITNDVRSIGRPQSFMYSYILDVKVCAYVNPVFNVWKGRILTDAFIYHLNDEQSAKSRYLIELDSQCASSVSSYFVRYNIRKKVGFTYF